MPDVARSIAITFMEPDQSITRKDVGDWIDKASDMADAKIGALSETYPKWLRLCSITASKGDDIQHHLWSMDGPEYDWENPMVTELLSQATALAGIALSWALRHPNKAQDLFHDPDALESTELELQELVSAQSIYSGWLNMAEMLVSRYSDEEELPRYEDIT